MDEVRRSTAVALARAEEGAQRDTVIELRHAGVALGGRSVWHDVSLQIHDGEFIAVLGPNGAGKTTFIKALLGLIPLSSGSITVLGHAAGHGNPAVGYVPQRRSFGAEVHVRGRDVVRLGLDGARWGTPLPGLGSLWQSAHSRDRQRRVQSVIELVGAERYADRPIGELSGGEQQRLLIAQALVTRPRVLLLDEPLDSLDLRNQGEMSGVISRISRESDTAVLLVAHDVNPLLPYVDRVCYVAHGHMAMGRPEEIITTESLTRLYDAPVEVLQASDGRLVVVGQPEGDHGHGHHGHDG